MLNTAEMDRYSNMSRRELTFEACDALAQQGKKPSVALVFEQTMALAGIKKGSAGDVQADIGLWYDDLFASKRDRRLIDVPAPVAAAFRKIWLGAVEQADEGLASHRSAAAAQVDAAEAEVERANALAENMRQQLALAHIEIEARDATIVRLDDEAASFKSVIMALNARLGAKDERIEALTGELSRKATDHAAAITELDGARKHALLQIDQARGETRHWKEQWERSADETRGARTAADTYRNKASALEVELAGAKGRLSQIPQLQESVADEKARSAVLGEQLASEQSFSRKLQAELSDTRIAGESARAGLAAAENALALAREATAHAAARERAALEEVAGLRAAQPGPTLEQPKQ